MSEVIKERAGLELNNDAPRMSHYLHPINPGKFWCGKNRKPGPIARPTFCAGVPVGVDCVVCTEFKATFGVDGWMRGVSP